MEDFVYGFLSQLSSWDEEDFQLHVSIAAIKKEYPFRKFFVKKKRKFAIIIILSIRAYSI